MGFLMPKAPAAPSPLAIAQAQAAVGPPPTPSAPLIAPPQKAPRTPNLGGTYLTGASPIGETNLAPKKKLFGQ